MWLPGTATVWMISPHINRGAPYDKWSSDPWIALAIYDQFAKHFGWGTLSQWMRTYTQSMKTQRPTTDAEVIDQWADRMINVTAMDLMPLYDFWNIPVSTSIRTKAKQYPCFLPLDWLTSLNKKSRYTLIANQYGGKCKTTALKTISYNTPPSLNVFHVLDVNVKVLSR